MLRENGIRALQPARLTTMQRLRKRRRDETPPTEDENDLPPVPTKTVGPIHEDEHVTEAVVICVAGIVDQLNERALAGSKIEKSGTRVNYQRSRPRRHLPPRWPWRCGLIRRIG